MSPSALRSLLIISLLALTLAAGSQLFSQEPEAAVPPPARSCCVAFVDVQAILERSRAVSEVLDVLDRSMADEVRDIQEKEARFASLRFEYERQQDLLAREERERRRIELGTLRDEIDRLKFDLDRKWRAGERQIEPLLEKVMDVVADVAVREGYEIVVRGEIVIYGRESANLTALVVEELDSRSPEIVEMFRSLTPLVTPAEQDEPVEQPEEPIDPGPQRPREILPAIP